MEIFKCNIISLFISTVLTFIGTPFIYNMLKDNNCTCLNYKKEEIPTSMGLLFVIVQTFTVGLMGFFITEFTHYVLLYLVGLIFIALAGLFDDLVGDKFVKGFKGHIKSFFKGTLTSGGLKAGIGFLVSLIISIYISKNIVEVIINTLVISLFTNLLNLFDLRPGRAGKVFVLISINLLVTTSTSKFDFILYSFIGILIRYLPMDLKAKAMMGDIGSNALGISLGAYCAMTHDLKSKIIYLIVLVCIQVIAEFVSFSKIIEQNRLLRFFDNLGR